MTSFKFKSYNVPTDCFLSVITALRITNLEKMLILSIPVKNKVKKKLFNYLVGVI